MIADSFSLVIYNGSIELTCLDCDEHIDHQATWTLDELLDAANDHECATDSV
jgi:hypothetical protein